MEKSTRCYQLCSHIITYCRCDNYSAAQDYIDHDNSLDMKKQMGSLSKKLNVITQDDEKPE